MRLRTWSAKWGVEAPARARMSSAVISWPASEQLRALRLAHGSSPDLGQRRQIVYFGLLVHVDCPFVSDHPHVVVEGAGRIGGVARLDVEQVPAQRRRQRSGAVGEQQRTPGARGRERRGGRGVERRVAAGDDEAVAGVVDVPAEAAFGVAGEGDRVRHRVPAGDAMDPAVDLGDLAAPRPRRSPRRARARRPAALEWRFSAAAVAAGSVSRPAKRTGSPDRAAQAAAGIAKPGCWEERDHDVFGRGAEQPVAQPLDCRRGRGGSAAP